MQEGTKNRWLHGLVTGLIFVVMLVIIAFLYPGKVGSFKYHYEVGKPWKYGLLTADHDFPILKTDEQLKSEQKAALADFAPYYKVNDASERIALISDSAKLHVSAAEQAYLSRQLKKIYATGIMSVGTMDSLLSDYGSIFVLDKKHHAVRHSLVEYQTPRSAYQLIVDNSPLGDKTQLTDMKLHLLLTPNMTFDSAATASMREHILASVSASEDMVVKDQKIIDRGEIVDAHTYQILKSLEEDLNSRDEGYRRAYLSLGGAIFLFVLFVALMAMYLRVFRPVLFSDYRTLLFFAILMTTIIAAACCVERFTALSIYIVPFAWVPIIIRVFYDSRTALFMHMVVTLICSFVAPQPFEFIILQMAAGMMTVSSLKDMAQRSQLAQTALWIFLTYCACYTAFLLSVSGSFSVLHWHTYLYFLANALLVIFSYGLIYIFEKAFGLVSSITLVELTNINSDLLVEFAEKAPGSFQHSLQVSSLAVDAAKRVGANPLLVRTGALYHDIGKMAAPQNFTENQQNGQNPLMQLSLEDAAQEVIAHVKNGLEIAEKHHLPEVVTRFIAMHHGTTKTRYFYNSWLNAHPGEKPNDALFSYPGPRPSTKEVAIVMMADAVEARSRSLSEYTEDSIRQMVDQMIGAQMADQQFEETPLTFRDIHEIKKIFTKKLIAMNHHRIAYPELKFDAPKA